MKQILLPFWNGSHRFAWRFGEYVDAILHRRFEHCTVCGRFGPILYRRWVIPSRLEALWGLTPRVADALARKESSNCARCGAKLRARRLAQVIIDEFPLQRPRPLKSIADWIACPSSKALKVAEINQVDGLHSLMQNLAQFSSSEYLPGIKPGTVVNGVRCEDLMGLTYPDATFDLVVTSETLEHVPDLATALREIHRVLVPGGFHIFTIPLLPTVEQTFARAVLGDDGTIKPVQGPLIHHPGGDVGYPVFTEFGADFSGIVRAAGFSCEVRFGPPSEDDIAQVFLSRKQVTDSLRC